MDLWRFCDPKEIKMWLALWSISMLLMTTNGQDMFGAVLRHFWDWRMKNSPEFSTYQGEYGYNDVTQSLNLSVIEQKKADAELFLSMLSVIDVEELSKFDRIEYRIFQESLQAYIAGHKWASYSLNPVNFLEGMHLFYPAEKATTNTRGDYENYVVRMFKIPKLIDEVIARFEEAIRLDLTYHNVSIIPVPGQIGELLVDNVEESLFYKPFNETLQEKTSIPQKDKESLRKRGKEGIVVMLGAYRKLKGYIEQVYLKHTRPLPGVSSLPDGAEYYRACLGWHATLDVSPEQVHYLGVQEVSRIHRNMQKVLKRQSFPGSIKAFFDNINNDSRFIRDDTDEIIQIYTDMINNRIKPILPNYFQNIPDVKLTIEKSPYDGPGGSYGLASDVNPGKFFINLFRPRENPTFDYMVLTLHEAYPGHHLQHSYSMTADLPKYRRFPEYSFYEVPFYLQYFSSYVEGWGLYSEYLGEEMGLYKDDFELMGRYSAEMMRACRLVLDTGLHYFNWTKEEAMDYMSTYVTYSREIIEIEVNRYITWPGQACAYKIGEIKIKKLRRKAEKELGTSFDIKEFHSTILENGPMSLSVLGSVVNDWIKEKQLNRAHNSATTSRTQLSLLIIVLSISSLHRVLPWTNIYV